MKKKLGSAMLTGSLLGVTASMVAVSKMNPKQRKQMVKISRKAMANMMENIGLY